MTPVQTDPIRILAVDPALRNTGYAILERTGVKPVCRLHGTIRNKRELSFPGCLAAIHTAISGPLIEWRPSALAIEGVIFVQSYQTAITLGAARGSAILAAAQLGLPVHEYAPRRAKQAVVGRGAASKGQVAFMVRAVLGMTETPDPDAADAIAIGLAHFHAFDAAVARRQPLPCL